MEFRVFEIALTGLIVLVAAASRAVTGSRTAAWTTVVAAAAWPFINHPIEGPVLMTVSPHHGLTVSDLLAPMAVVLALLVLTGVLRKASAAAVSRRPGGVS